MSALDPKKLHVTFKTGASPRFLELPRCYTLTHSDFSGELFLTIGATYDRKQISGLFTRLMRDEVLAEWEKPDGQPGLHVDCHVSGGIVLGTAGWRNEILHYHMPMVLEAFRHGDKELFALNPELENARVMVHFVSNHRRYDQVEDWGQIRKYRIEAT
jgi:hypothetical protein